MRRDRETARLALRKQTFRALSVRQLAGVASGVMLADVDGSGSYFGDSQTQGPGGWSNCCNCG
jgi:hypothetical protein